MLAANVIDLNRPYYDPIFLELKNRLRSILYQYHVSYCRISMRNTEI